MNLGDFLTPKAQTAEPDTSPNGFQNRSQNGAKTIMGNQPKIMKISTESETSKTMLSSKCGAHLHKHASFKKTPEKIQTSHRNNIKNDLKTIWKYFKKSLQKMMRNIIEQHHPKYHKRHFDSHVGARCLALSRSGAFLFATCFGEPLGGILWTDVSPFWGTPGPNFIFWTISGPILVQMSQSPRHQPHLQKIKIK